jgi:hypothetical protein
MTNLVKSFLIFVNQKNPLNKPPNLVKSFCIFTNNNPYPDNLVVTEKPNNATFTGFNDWGYSIVPPDNLQVKEFFNATNTYDEVIDIIANNAEITATNIGGIITDLQQNN